MLANHSSHSSSRPCWSISLKMCKLLIIILYYSIITLTSASRILAVFPTPCISHQVTFRPLIHELVRRGHQVTFITPDPAFDKGKAPSNLTEIDVHDISYDIWRNNIVKTTEFGRKDLIIEQIENILYQLVRLTAEQVKKKEVQNIINNKDTKYDLLLLEACAITALVYSHVFKIPVIQVSSFGMMIGNDEIVGSPTHPLLYPTIIHQRLYNLSIWEKLDELYKHIKMMRINANAEIVGHKTFQNIIGSDLPSFNVLKNNVDMLFLNIHPIWIDNQPLPPNVISIWGIYKKTPKELPQELKSYLDSSKQGVIYISLGSNALSSDLPPEIIQMFIRVFSQLPYNVLWKWEKDELPGRPQNVKISKWFPQSDLLRGLQSTEDAINAGVPLIGIPMLSDQWYNVEKYARHGIGIKLDMDTLNEEQFKAAIDKVLIHKSYKENIIRLRTLFHDQPENALDRAIWWTEYVLRHNGAKHLRSPAANMSWMQYYEIQLILIVLILVLLCTSASRILAVFPTPSVSHQVIFRPLIHELVRRGHQVTFITPNPAFGKGKAPSNLTEIDVHDISYDIWKKNVVENIEFGRKDLTVGQIENMIYQILRVNEEQMKTKEVHNIINNKDIKFDLLLLEACAITTLAYSHIFKIPVIQVSSFGMMMGSNEIVGSPSHPFLYPSAANQRLYNLSIWEKLDELYKHMTMMRSLNHLEIVQYKNLQNIIGSDLPSFNVLKNNVDMLFINIHPIWIDNQPLPPNVISIWGIREKTPKELPQDLKKYLDSSKQGVIYLSFGSNAPSSKLPPETIQMFIRVFSQLPYNVLWKWEKDELPGRPQNVIISKWFPQSDLLRGLQSTEEAINAGVPLIGIPVLGDQWYNVEKYARHGIGIKLDMDTLNEEQFKAAVDKVLTDKSYKENILKLRALFNDQPQTALDRAIWWTEYVLRHNGAKHLRSPAANMSWMQYYEIQLILIVLILVLLCSVVLVISVHVLWKYLLPNLMEHIKIKTA
ncbi:unnamed protein product [Leptidea sinapis]|uniref:UDP-glycosyltransferases domain-containing protein n=1 Tax=Leptidea sinapis TaxID=189913 RepID=A0A5E4QW96_9NEOP|nr:unnamed protein product [Leptidea sinapis]